MTPRQQQLLYAIIQEYIESAEAVGSLSLRDKYSFKVSSATIRNEMAELVRTGYLNQLHSSSGRVPTTMGLRLFIEELLKHLEELDVVTQEEVKQSLHSLRFEREALIREGLRYLAKLTHNSSVALVDRDIYYAGLAEMLNIPEFHEIENLRQVMLILEDYSILSQLFNQSQSDNEVKVLIGEESGLSAFHNYAVVFSGLDLHGERKGYLSVIGPNRMNYEKTIPAVKLVAYAINRAASGW